MIEATHN